MAIIQIGQEPENIKKRLRNLFEKLDGAYPDKVITRLHQDHKNWGETVTSLYRELGYPDGNSFLEAYGYKVEKTAGGRPKSNHMAVIDELKRRYANGPTCVKMDQLKEENPDLAPKFHNLANQANQLFGMPLIQYLILNGILLGETPIDHDKEFQRLKDRYCGHPYAGQMKDLRADNKDIKWSAVEWAFEHQNVAKTMKAFLIKEGILAEESTSALQQLKDRYKEAPFDGLLKELKEANHDIRWSEVEKEFRKNGNAKTVSEFLVMEHVLHENAIKTRKEILADLTLSLQSKYKSRSIPESLEQIISENPEISFDSLTKLAHSLHALSLEEYLAWKGLLRDPQAKKKLAQIMSVLKVRYSDMPEIDKPTSISRLQEANPDIDLRSITPLAKAAFGVTGTDYLAQEGILRDWGRVEAERRKHEEDEWRRRKEELATLRQRREKELNSPVEPWIYEPKKYQVAKVSITGDAVNDWVYSEKEVDGSPELYLIDYQGKDTHIIFPVSISGKRVVGFDSESHCLFKECKAETVEIPGSFEIVPNSCFSYNKYLKHVVIGEGIKEIGAGAFGSAYNLEVVEASQSIEMVGSGSFNSTKWFDRQIDYAFIGRVLLHYSGDGAVLNIPIGIKTVASAVTHSDIIKVFIPDTVETLCYKAFDSCPNIQEFYFSESLKNIGSESFGENKWIDSFDSNPIIINGHLYRWNTSVDEVLIPEGVTTICESVFENRKQIKRVEFPEALKEIGDSAFRGCDGLSEVVLPKGLLHIGPMAFAGCGNLKTVVFGDSLTSIGGAAFYFCTSLQRAILPDSLQKIDRNAFKACKSLESIVIPRSVEDIMDHAFEDCSSLKSVIFEGEVQHLGAEVFTNTPYFKSSIPSSQYSFVVENDILIKCSGGAEDGHVKLPKGIKIIGEDAFDEHLHGSKLISLDLNDEVEVIRDRAFQWLTSLESVTGAGKIKRIGNRAFSSCWNLADFDYPSTAEVAEEAFCECQKLTGPDGMLIINRDLMAFDYGKYKETTAASEITSITIPYGVERISGIHLNDPWWVINEFIIPDTVKYIDPDQFMIYGIESFKVIDKYGATILEESFIPESGFMIVDNNEFLDFCDEIESRILSAQRGS